MNTYCKKCYSFDLHLLQDYVLENHLHYFGDVASVLMTIIQQLLLL